jgi:putative NADH-flavin reductase
MRVAIIGATGLLGVGMVPEAASRGHAVTAICRHPEQVGDCENVTALACDVFDTAKLTEALRGHDAVIHSYSPRRDYQTDRSAPHIAATRSIIAATRFAGVSRLLAVGGAGTLLLPDGTKVMDSSEFPPEFLESAISTGHVKKILEDEADDLEWTFLCPSLFFDERGRSGVFRLGFDDALFDENGHSSISVEDYAIAMIDELEAPRHTRTRFTAGY